MSDTHDHTEADAPRATAKKNMSDSLFQRVENYITNSIQRFVAFLFILVSIGAVLGFLLAQKADAEIFVLIPAFAGLLAYYNRDFAVAVFTFFLLLVIAV